MADQIPPKRPPIPLDPSPEKKALARKLAGLPPLPAAATEVTETAPAPTRPVVQPIRERPEDHVDWWREQVGSLLLVIDQVPNASAVEVRLEAVSPNGEYIRVRPTHGAFIWRPRIAIRLLDVIAYPEDIRAFEQGIAMFYGTDQPAIEKLVDERIAAFVAAQS